MKQLLKSTIFTIFSLVFCAGISFAQSAEQPFKITGKIIGNPKIVQISAMFASDETGGNKTIQAKVHNGQYTISGTITKPTGLILEGEGSEDDETFDYQDAANKYILYLVPGNVVLLSNKTLANTQASGTGARWNKDSQYLAKQQKLVTDSTRILQALSSEINSRMQQYTEGKAPRSYGLKEYNKDSLTLKRIAPFAYSMGLDSLLIYHTLIPYIKKNPASPLALMALNMMSPNPTNPNLRFATPEFQLSFFELLSPQVKASEAGQATKKQLDMRSRTALGKVAPAISLPDTSGNILSLSSLRGKYVLIDFWAHWCAPCRAEVPYMRKAYEKYQADNFTILAVSKSDNTSKEAWKRAIVEDHSNWYHMYDDTKIASLRYNVSYIPRNFLIDPKGVIIALDLRGDDLEKKLKEIFGK